MVFEMVKTQYRLIDYLNFLIIVYFTADKKILHETVLWSIVLMVLYFLHPYRDANIKIGNVT